MGPRRATPGGPLGPLANVVPLAPSRRLLAFAAACVCVVLLLRGETGDGRRPELTALGRKQGSDARLAQYCSPPVDRGAEGRPPRSDLELHAVVLTIRHGDRSAIHTIPGSLPQEGQRFSCAPGDLEGTWRGLSERYRVLGKATAKPLPARLQPELKEGSEDECARGQLTARGFRQHMALGEHLSVAYKQFLAGLRPDGATRPHGNLYVRSTDYPRTIASTAALLETMLPPSVWPTPITIEVNEDESAEIMHGVGFKTSSKAGDGKAERPVAGSCQAAVRHSAQQFNAWQKPRAEYDSLGKLFGEAVHGRGIPDLMDSVYAASCHGHRLPCGAGGCATRALATALAHRADEFYCARFAGSQGGEAATRLAFYPFMSEVLRWLEQAGAAEAPPALTVFSGHDTVIAPLLSALGVYRGRHCRWPPYASRIAFELYRGAGAREGGGPLYVRVLFNGEALSGVRGCRPSEELCPLRNFAEGVQSLLGGKADLQAACAVDT